MKKKRMNKLRKVELIIYGYGRRLIYDIAEANVNADSSKKIYMDGIIKKETLKIGKVPR